jgi:hypothetical protein
MDLTPSKVFESDRAMASVKGRNEAALLRVAKDLFARKFFFKFMKRTPVFKPALCAVAGPLQ